MTNLNFPCGLVSGVTDQGMKVQSGSVITTNNRTMTKPFAIRSSQLGGLPSSSRFESYHIFSTDSRRVNIVNGEDIRRANMPSAFSPDNVRKRRAEVSTRSHSTTNRP